MNNQLCPYTCQPVAALAANREHIIPDALGGPNGFALAADAQRNLDYGRSVDSRLINSPLLGMLAAAARVQTRSGPATWKSSGTLIADGSRVEMVGSAGQMAFRFRKPVEVDPSTGRVHAVRGFGADVDKELAQVRKNLKRKGWALQQVESKVLGAAVKGGFEHNISEMAQGLTKIAYLATVWAIGDGFIRTDAGAQYRRWIDAEPTEAGLDAAGLQPVWKSMFKDGGTPGGQHRVACLSREGLLLTGVRLFNASFVDITIAVEVPELDLPDGHGWIATIDATTKSFREAQLVP